MKKKQDSNRAGRHYRYASGSAWGRDTRVSTTVRPYYGTDSAHPGSARLACGVT